MISIQECVQLGIKFQKGDLVSMDVENQDFRELSDSIVEYVNSKEPFLVDIWKDSLVKEFVLRTNTGEMCYPKGLPVEVLFCNGAVARGLAGIDDCCDTFNQRKNDYTYIITHHRPDLDGIKIMCPEYFI